MLGEGMLGLDGAMASFIEPGDRVLVLANGPFGAGFEELAKLYGGVPTVYSADPRRGIDGEKLQAFLEKDHDFKLATLIHCETPNGVTNDIHTLGPILHRHGILSVVDSVSAVGGEELDFDRAEVDVVIGGTQKCLSALTGLTTITLSERAEKALKERKTSVAGFYGNFQNYLPREDAEGFAFPYTQSDTLVYALDEALNIALEYDFVARHRDFAERTRRRIGEWGYEIYALDSFSNTVTALLLRPHQSTREILDAMMEKGYMLSGEMGELSGRAIRIGHMGNNIADEADFERMLDALGEVLSR